MDEIPQINVPYEELKHMVLGSIKKHGDSFQFKNLCHTIGHSAVENGIINNPYPDGRQTVYYPLQKVDENRVREVLWDLIIERVVTIGDYHNDSWPWLSLTDYGKRALNSTLPIPNDSTGYLNRIRTEIPQIDPIIEIYLTESIRTYNINQLLSSTITLGCASEKSLLILIDTFKETFVDGSKMATFSKKIEGKFIKTKFDEFNKVIIQILPQLPNDLREKYTNTLTGIFEMIRYNRNDAGHPSGKQVDKDTLFANLQVFIPYCKYIYELKHHFDSNKHD